VVRSLRGQPAIPAFGQASQETREWAGNPGFWRIRCRLWTPGSPDLRWKSQKVSRPDREYSRLTETIGGDGFDQNCRPNSAEKSFLTGSCSLLKNYSKNGAIHFVCMDWKHLDELLVAGREVYTELKNIVAWAKSAAGMGSLYRSQHELICVFKSGVGRHINNVELGKNGRNRTNVWQYDSAGTQARKGNNVLELHPTVKPVQMVMDALLDCSNRGDIVIDSFLGSGTTLLAAERTGRICRGIELDPLYVDTAIRRWQNLTGRDAVRVSDGMLFRDIEAKAEQGDE
jgi:hypothetical protein